ncbi:hypothetical protein CRENBAI_023009 [Crenichthys baileyi]|uniref:Uncharacterized protein n=1 Tax=Crenichthys baileyi TaxID=28760 RepID=A0AAV9RLB9_9TELE
MEWSWSGPQNADRQVAAWRGQELRRLADPQRLGQELRHRVIWYSSTSSQSPQSQENTTKLQVNLWFCTQYPVLPPSRNSGSSFSRGLSSYVASSWLSLVKGSLGSPTNEPCSPSNELPSKNIYQVSKTTTKQRKQLAWIELRPIKADLQQERNRLVPSTK